MMLRTAASLTIGLGGGCEIHALSLAQLGQRRFVLRVPAEARCRPLHMTIPLLHRTSENSVTHELELRRIPLPRTPVNKGIRKGRSPKKGRDPDHRLPSRCGYERGRLVPTPVPGPSRYFLPMVFLLGRPRDMGRGARCTKDRDSARTRYPCNPARRAAHKTAPEYRKGTPPRDQSHLVLRRSRSN